MKRSAKDIFWPKIAGKRSAREAVKLAMATAFVIAIATGVLIFFQSTSTSDFWKSLPQPVWIDAIIFMVLGIGLYFNSRIVALAALVIYVYGQYQVVRAGNSITILMILFTLNFINGMRGSFYYHIYKHSDFEEEENTKPVAQNTSEAASPKRSKLKWIAIGLLLIAVSAVGLFALMYRSSSPSPSTSSEISENVVPKNKTIAPADDSKGMRIFRLKDGREIRGKVVYEDSVYYSVETSGRTEIVIKEDIA